QGKKKKKKKCTFKKNQAMAAAWSNEDSSTSGNEKEEVKALMCFMAKSDEEEVSSSNSSSFSSENENDFSMEELQDVFKELFEKICFLQKEDKILKNDFSELKLENTSLFQEKKSLEEKLDDFSKKNFPSKIHALSSENENLKNSISRFEKG